MECPLIGALFDVMRRMRDEERLPRDYGVGEPLYHSELRLLDLIDQNPQKRAGTLSEALGVTKGALAQVAKRLTDKGLIEEYNAEGNRKEKYYRLTALGEEARAGHIRHHDQSIGRMKSYLCSRSEDEKRVLTEFLKEIGQCMPLWPYNCSSPDCGCAAIAKHDTHDTNEMKS